MQAEFKGSYVDVSKMPKSDLVEFCFWGRSNVGKSSLINFICHHNSLAKVSSTPGKTQTINLFLLEQNISLVDLPGYGFTKLSKSTSSKFKQFCLDYIEKRENLYCVFILVDSSIPPQKIDLEILSWMGQHAVPFIIVFTKVDRNSKRELELFKAKYAEALSSGWEELPRMVYVSVKKHTGREDILSIFDEAFTNS